MATIRSCHTIPSALLTVLIVCYANGQTTKNNHPDISQSEYEIFSALSHVHL
jgi:hypothetical protein